MNKIFLLLLCAITSHISLDASQAPDKPATKTNLLVGDQLLSTSLETAIRQTENSEIKYNYPIACTTTVLSYKHYKHDIKPEMVYGKQLTFLNSTETDTYEWDTGSPTSKLYFEIVRLKTALKKSSATSSSEEVD